MKAILAIVLLGLIGAVVYLGQVNMELSRENGHYQMWFSILQQAQDADQAKKKNL